MVKVDAILHLMLHMIITFNDDLLDGTITLICWQLKELK